MNLSKYSLSNRFGLPSSYNSATNLYIMDLNDDTRIERFDGYELLVRTLPISEQQVCTVFGSISKAQLEELCDVYDVVETVSPPPLPFTIDKDNAEYIYSIPDTISMAGGKYESVRRKVNRVEELSLEIEQPSSVEEQLWHIFESGVVEDDVNSEVELMAFEKWLIFADELPTDLIIVSNSDCIIGFAVVEIVNNTLLIHFFKTNKEIIGLAEYLFVNLARTYARKVEWINFQQDLGIEGLRKFKNHLQPIVQSLMYTL